MSGILASDRALVARSCDRLAALVAPYQDVPFTDLHDLMDPNELVDLAISGSVTSNRAYQALLDDYDEWLAICNAVAEEHDRRIKVEERAREVAAFAAILGMPLLPYQKDIVRRLLNEEIRAS